MNGLLFKAHGINNKKMPPNLSALSGEARRLVRNGGDSLRGLYRSPKRHHQCINSGRLRVIGLPTLNLVKRAERNARQRSEPMKISKPVILDCVLNECDRSHAEILPRSGNFSSKNQEISLTGNLSQNEKMEIREIRRVNLAAIVKTRFAKQRDFAAFIEKETTHANGWLKGTRPISYELSRELETVLGLRTLYLDEETPMTDEAFDFAHAFMKLNDENRAKMKARLAELKFIQQSLDKADEIRLLSSSEQNQA